MKLLEWPRVPVREILPFTQQVTSDSALPSIESDTGRQLLTLGLCRAPLTDKPLEARLQRLAWRQKLRTITQISLTDTEIRNTDILPNWAKEALGEGRLSLIAYSYKSQVEPEKQRSVIDNYFSDWCRKHEFHAMKTTSVAGNMMPEVLEQLSGSCHSKALSHGLILTDMQFL